MIGVALVIAVGVWVFEVGEAVSGVLVDEIAGVRIGV
jgi:hypothetical protein